MNKENTLKLWDKFKDSIIYNNRFFPEDKKIFDILDDLLAQITTISGGYMDRNNCFYRARLGEYTKEEDMRNPDPRKYPTNDGRCNPKGISYFYVAADQNTAIHEIRPEINETISIATFQNIEKLKICNFNAPQILEERLFERDLLNESESTLLKIILNELSQPINTKETLEYIPIQYIVEYIKHKSFDGFVYRSSLTQNMNYVFFDSTMFTFINNSIEHINVKSIEVYSKYNIK